MLLTFFSASSTTNLNYAVYILGSSIYSVNNRRLEPKKNGRNVRAEILYRTTVKITSLCRLMAKGGAELSNDDRSILLPVLNLRNI